MARNTARNLQETNRAANEVSRSLQKNPSSPPAAPEDAGALGSGSDVEIANASLRNIPTTGMSPQEIIDAPSELIQVGTNAIGADGTVIAGLPPANPTSTVFAGTAAEIAGETVALVPETGQVITVLGVSNPLGWVLAGVVAIGILAALAVGVHLFRSPNPAQDKLNAGAELNTDIAENGVKPLQEIGAPDKPVTATLPPDKNFVRSSTKALSPPGRQSNSPGATPKQRLSSILRRTGTSDDHFDLQGKWRMVIQRMVMSGGDTTSEGAYAQNANRGASVICDSVSRQQGGYSFSCPEIGTEILSQNGNQFTSTTNQGKETFKWSLLANPDGTITGHHFQISHDVPAPGLDTTYDFQFTGARVPN